MRLARTRDRWLVALSVTALAAAGIAGGSAAFLRSDGAEPVSGDGTAAAAPAAATGAADGDGAAADADGADADGTADTVAYAGGLEAAGAAVPPGTETSTPVTLSDALTRDPHPGWSVVTVRFKGTRATDAVRAGAFAGVVKRFGAKTRSTVDAVGAATVTVPDAQVDALVSALSTNGDVATARVANRFLPLLSPDDPQYAGQQKKYLSTSGLPSAWDLTKGSADVTIAVVDSGVDVGHPDLAGKIVDSWNTVTETTDVTDDMGHGTFVAGVAAAATNNGKGIAGAGFNSRILAVKVADEDGFMSEVDVASGIRWAADHDADVINISLGSSSKDAATRSAVEYAQAQGALVVAAAGNAAQYGNPKVYPAAYPGVVAVGATDAAGHRAWFSEHGSWVTIAAPGVGIRGTTPRAGSWLFAANYDTGDGTSFSSPIVAGAAALLVARAPGSTPAQLRASLTATATGYQGFGLGAGEVDAGRAVADIAPTSRPEVVSPSDGDVVSGYVTMEGKTHLPFTRLLFLVDGIQIRQVVNPGNIAWTSTGWANGEHTVEVRSCSRSGKCAPTGTTRTITLDNTTPTMTGLEDGATISGGVPVSVSGGVNRNVLFIDGVKTPLDGELNTSTLTDGEHTIEATVCSFNRVRCDGPRSTPVTVTVKSLHPALGKVTNRAFSPNGDGVKDTVSVRYRLDTRQAVTVTVLDSKGKAVRSVAKATKAAGTYTFTWNGKKDNKSKAKGGSYTVRVETQDPADATLKGLVTTVVQVDRTAPVLFVLTGNGVKLYPAKDGYLDTFSPKTQLDERARLTLRMRNSAGKTVRTISATKQAGKVSLTWDGLTASGARVPAGTYTWRFEATQTSGQHKKGGWRKVTVKSGKLTTRLAHIRRAGVKAYAAGGSASCAKAVTKGSSYAPTGLWLKNNCATSNPQSALAFYKVKLPSAVAYTSFKIVTTGRSHSAPSDLVAGVFSTQTGDYDLTPVYKVRGKKKSTLPLGTIRGAEHAKKGKADFVVYVPNERAPLVDWDIQRVRLVVKYQVIA